MYVKKYVKCFYYYCLLYPTATKYDYTNYRIKIKLITKKVLVKNLTNIKKTFILKLSSTVNVSALTRCVPVSPGPFSSEETGIQRKLY